MLLFIHNLPHNMRFLDVKSLIKDACGIDQVILDNFTDEGDTKRVTVGLANEGDAANLVRKINGLYLEGCQLFVETVRQKSADQPYRPMENLRIPKPRKEKQMIYSQSMPVRPEKEMLYSQSIPVRPETQSKYDQAMPVRPETQIKYDRAMPVRPGYQTKKEQSMPAIMPMVYSNLPFYMSPVQSSYKGYENQASQMREKPLPQPNYYQAQHKQPGTVNEWDVQPTYSSYSEQSRRLPDDYGDEPEWQKRQGARSTSMVDDESRWLENRYQSDIKRYEQDYRRFLERGDEISGNRISQFDKSRQDESDGRGRRDHSQGRGDDGKRSSKRNDDHTRPRRDDRSRSPRDRNFVDRRRPNLDDRARDSDYTESRRAIDHRERDRERDRDQKPGTDRFEKPRERDSYNEPRDGYKPRRDHDYDPRDFGKKRPYSEISQTSSRTYGNSPDNSTFSKSNANYFGKNDEEPMTGEFDIYKRLRLNKHDFAGLTQPNVNLKPNDAPGSEMVKKHNSLRFQCASILAKEIINIAHPGHVPNFSVILKKLKECIAARIDVRLGDRIVSSLAEMRDAYRSKFPFDNDVSLYRAVLEKIERDKKEIATANAKDITQDEPNNEITTTSSSNQSGSLPPPFKLPIAGSYPPPTVPPFQNRAPTSMPSYQTRPTSTLPFQNRTPNSTSQLQNRHLNPTLQFANSPPNPNPYYKNLATTSAPQFKKLAPVQTPQFQSRAPTPAPLFPNRAPISTPQFQKTAHTSTTQVHNKGLMSIPSQQCTAPIPPKKPPQPPQKAPNTKLTKKEMNNVRMLHKMEFKDEVMYMVDPCMRQAIENEMDNLIKLYTAQPESFANKTEENIHKRIVTETAPIFRKALTLNLTKRILNVATGLVLRVFPVGRWPNHGAFDRYMKQKGVVNIKKCSKMYVVTCGSYKSYDILLGMETLKIGDCNLIVKTMHVAGPKPSMRDKLKDSNFKTQNMQLAGGDAIMFDDDDFALDESDYVDHTDKANQSGASDNVQDKIKTEPDDVVYVKSESEDEKEEATNGTNAGKAGGSGKNNNKDSTQPKDDVENVESLEKDSQETAENVDTLEHESKATDQNVVSLDKNEETKGNAETLERESQPTAQNIVSLDENETEGNVTTLEQESNPIIQNAVSLDKNEGTKGNVETLEQECEPSDQNVVSLDENKETEGNIKTLEQESNPIVQNVVSLDKNEKTKGNIVTLEQESEPTNQNAVSLHGNQTDGNVTEDITKSEIIDDIADDDLEDF